MQVLEGEIKRLEAEYNMFFAGRLPRLPWEQRARVEALVKRHDRGDTPNTAERFRFHTLQSRYAAFSELWERQLQQQEQGRRRVDRVGRAAAGAAEAAKSPPAPKEAAAHSPDRIVDVAGVRDPAAQTERVQELYECLAEAKREVGEAPMPYERVAELVRAQVVKFANEGHQVVFRVELKDGRVSLTVRPVKDE